MALCLEKFSEIWSLFWMGEIKMSTRGTVTVEIYSMWFHCKHKHKRFINTQTHQHSIKDRFIGAELKKRLNKKQKYFRKPSNSESAQCLLSYEPLALLWSVTWQWHSMLKISTIKISLFLASRKEIRQILPVCNHAVSFLNSKHSKQESLKNSVIESIAISESTPTACYCRRDSKTFLNQESKSIKVEEI